MHQKKVLKMKDGPMVIDQVFLQKTFHVLATLYKKKKYETI